MTEQIYPCAWCGEDVAVEPYVKDYVHVETGSIWCEDGQRARVAAP